jgi:acetyltransferase
LIEVLLRVSNSHARFRPCANADINPLLADEHGVIALDARVLVSMPAGGRRHLFTSGDPSVPRALVREVSVKDGRILLRPIRPEDAEAERRFISRLSPALRTCVSTRQSAS